MAKIHLAANKGLNGTPVYAACASRDAGEREVRRNSRATYRYMSSTIVPYSEFKSVPASERCAHCMARGLDMKNRQRKAKGLPPAAHLFDTL